MDNINVNLLPEETINIEVPDINYIPGYKVAEEERRANELNRISNENERETYYEDFKQRVDNGEFKGETGPQGETGETGPQGETGMSAYESARLGGYEGTEAEFYADLGSIQDFADSLAEINSGGGI